MPAELASASALTRSVCLAFRVAGAAVTVPVAEELAFRGYALRRLQSADFTSVDLRRSKLAPLAISSVLFGLLHGQWIAGTIAGGLYAAIARKRGNLADTAAAHAVTSSLLSAWVLYVGAWQLW
jgi:CAAX prenyl protease-like protein